MVVSVDKYSEQLKKEKRFKELKAYLLLELLHTLKHGDVETFLTSIFDYFPNLREVEVFNPEKHNPIDYLFDVVLALE